MEVCLQARNVSLTVPNYVHEGRWGENRSNGWWSMLFSAAASPVVREQRPLLHDIGFTLGDGDRLALLGRNGAGKTTLLRVLAGSLVPTSGEVYSRGSKQALLNLALGFNPEATVRENVFLRGTAMGMRASEIRDALASVLEFAELEHVASHRLATLSSGQRLRLGFAVSTATQRDIMLLDEWFGAGDASFVRKARGRMADRVHGSRIVVLASHNFQMLREICNQGMVVEDGRVLFHGDVEDAISAYKKSYQETEEYVSQRKQVEDAAERMVRQRIKELERESREGLRDKVAELKVLKEKLREDRADVHRIRERLLVRMGGGRQLGDDGKD